MTTEPQDVSHTGNVVEGDVGTIGRIPVRNIWLLMLYASDLFREISQHCRNNMEENPDDIPDLVAEILIHSVERRLRRNLSIGFQDRCAVLSRVRGQIDLIRTERRHLLQRGQVACRYSELTVDTPENRFVKAALGHLAKIVKREFVHRCRRVVVNLEGLGVTTETSVGGPHDYRSWPLRALGRMNVLDQEMLAAASLAFNLALPTEEPGQTYLSSPSRDEVWARKLFEKAVGGFYKVVLHYYGDWSIHLGNRISWPFECSTPDIQRILPSMETDIVLEYENKSDCKNRCRIVVDTKFTSIVSAGRYGKERLHSGYIYQLYAYVRSREQEDDRLSRHAIGMLLHPSIGANFRESTVIQGHELRFATVDLTANSKEIRQRLLDVVQISPLDVRQTTSNS